jgi:Type II secretion system (T2SS), protein M subtype b
MTATATLRARVELWTWRHGWWLPLCLVLCAAAAVLAWDARSSTLQLRALASTLPVAAAPVAPPARNTAAEDAQRVAALRELLLPSHEATAAVRRLVGLTQPELAWQRAEFQHSDDAAPGVARLQITVPVSGEYRAMRRALQRALAEMPQLSLDQLQLRREQAGESQLETRLRFSLWLRTKAKGSK